MSGNRENVYDDPARWGERFDTAEEALFAAYCTGFRQAASFSGDLSSTEMLARGREYVRTHATPDNAGRSSIEYDDHEFYQDALPREMGRCDYTYPTGEPCGEDRGFHWHERSSIDVERLARALFAVPDEDAQAIAAEYARLSDSTGSEGPR